MIRLSMTGYSDLAIFATEAKAAKNELGEALVEDKEVVRPFFTCNGLM